MVHKGTSAGLGDNMKLKVVLLVLVILFPGCLEDTQEEPSEQGENGFVGVGGYTNISMEIIHGESVRTPLLSTIRIMLNHTAAPMHADNMHKHVAAGNYDMTQYHRIIDDFWCRDFENNDGTGGYAADWYGYCNGQAMADASNSPAMNGPSRMKPTTVCSIARAALRPRPPTPPGAILLCPTTSTTTRGWTVFIPCLVKSRTVASVTAIFEVETDATIARCAGDHHQRHRG